MLLKFDPNPKQRIAAEKWVDKTTKEICYGGAKYGGKSFLGANLIFHDALVYPDTFYFIARERLIDLRKYTVPTIHSVFKNWKLNIDDYAKYNGQDSFFDLYNDSRVYLLECTFLPGDPLFERFGSMEMTRGWIEEGGEINSLAKENLRISIGRKNNQKHNLSQKLLITCNPKKNFLYSEFYKPFMNGTLPKDKAFIQAYADDNIHGSKEYIDNLKSMKDRVMKERLLKGNWEYNDDDTALIVYDNIMELFSSKQAEGKKYISADIARFGKDKSIIMLWSGFNVKEIIELSKSSVTETSNAIKKLSYQHSIHRSSIIVDEDGVGGGVKDILKCEGFVNNSSAIKIEGEKENYANLKSQCTFKLADKINEKQVSISCDSEQVKENIIEELEQVKRKSVDTDGKLAVIAKEDVKAVIGRSPDYSDTLMMRMYFELKPKQTAPRSTIIS